MSGLALEDGFEVAPVHLYLDRQPDAVRWLRSNELENLKKYIAVASWDFDSEKGQVDFCQLSVKDLTYSPMHLDEEEGPALQMLESWTQPGRVTALQVVPTDDPNAHCAVSSTSHGHVCCMTFNPFSSQARTQKPPQILSRPHSGPVTGMDIHPDSGDVLTVGMDGRMCITRMDESGGREPTRVVDFKGGFSFTAARWTSPDTVVTGGSGGASLLCWDCRQKDQATSQLPPPPGSGPSTKVLCVDVHASRKHLCAVGCTQGEVLFWDLRYQKQPIYLMGNSAVKGRGGHWGSSVANFEAPVLEGDVWAIQFDLLAEQLSKGELGMNLGGDSSKGPHLMVCSQDGVMASVGGNEVVPLLDEPFAINSFDCEGGQYGQDVICGSDSECLIYFRRPR